MGIEKIFSILRARTDEEAMCRVKTHDDHREFAALVERWQQPILNLCTRMTGDIHRGEDLKQETFSRLFQKRKDFEPGGRFSSWLWRMALNVCYDDLRRGHRRPELSNSLAQDGSDALEECVAESPGPDDSAAQLEEGELVRRALLQLPEIYRTVLVLRHYEDLKLGRIAEILGIPEGTVNSRMAEALSRLSRILQPQLGGKPRVTPLPNKINQPIEAFIL